MSDAKPKGWPPPGTKRGKRFGIGNANASTFWRGGEALVCTRLRVSLPTDPTHRKLMHYVGLTGQSPSQLLAAIIDAMPDPDLVMHTHPAGLKVLIDALKK